MFAFQTCILYYTILYTSPSWHSRLLNDRFQDHLPGNLLLVMATNAVSMRIDGCTVSCQKQYSLTPTGACMYVTVNSMCKVHPEVSACVRVCTVSLQSGRAICVQEDIMCLKCIFSNELCTYYDNCITLLCLRCGSRTL